MYVWHGQVCHAVDLRSAWEKQIAYNPSQLLQACEGLCGLCWRTMISENGKEGNSQPMPSISSYTHAVFSGARDTSLKGERRNKQENHTWDLLQVTFPEHPQQTLWVLTKAWVVDHLLKTAIWAIDGHYCSTTINNKMQREMSETTDMKLDLLIWSDC